MTRPVNVESSTFEAVGATALDAAASGGTHHYNVRAGATEQPPTTATPSSLLQPQLVTSSSL
jgi:hypothetical protein